MAINKHGNRRHIGEFDSAYCSTLKHIENIRLRNLPKVDANKIAPKREPSDIVAFIAMLIFSAGMVALAIGIASH